MASPDFPVESDDADDAQGEEFIHWVGLCAYVLLCLMLNYIVLCCTVLYCTVLYCTVLYCTVLYCTVLYCTVPVLYCTVLYCTVLHCTIRYTLSCIFVQSTNSSEHHSSYPFTSLLMFVGCRQYIEGEHTYGRCCCTVRSTLPSVQLRVNHFS